MKRLIFIALCLYSLNSNMFCSEYAILISAGKTTKDNTELNSEYWYDLYLAYEDLVLKEGYDPSNIYVFYGDGTSFNSNRPRYNIALHNWSNIVNFDNSYNTLNEQLANIGNIITTNDNLVIRWVVGHGSGNAATTVTTNQGGRTPIDSDDYWVYLENRNLSIRESEIIRIINLIPNYKRRKIFWMTCYSGCLSKGANNLNNNKTVIITASDWNQASQSTRLENDTYHAFFNYVITSSLFGYDPVGNIFNSCSYIDPFDNTHYSVIDTNDDGVNDMKELRDIYHFMYSSSTLGDIGDLANKIFVDEHLVFESINLHNNIQYKVEDIKFKNDNSITNNASILINANNSFEIDGEFETTIGTTFEVQN